MKTLLLKQARELGHHMVLVSPGRYECSDCPATIQSNGCRSENWQASKTGNICLEARPFLTVAGTDALKASKSSAQ